MRVEPAGEAQPQTISEPTRWSPELGLGTAASNATYVVGALTVGGLLDLGPTSTYYVGPIGFVTPVCADDPVVDVVGVDRKLFDAANAAKARTHFCWGIGSLAGGYEPGPGPKMAILGAAEGLCCVPPWTGHMLAFSPIFLSAFLYNTLCSKHKDMEFPPWAGAALVMTDKGVIGRRHFVPHSQINAISWGGSTSTETSGFAPTTRAGAPQSRLVILSPIPGTRWSVGCTLACSCRAAGASASSQKSQACIVRPSSASTRPPLEPGGRADPWRYRLEVSISSRLLARRKS